MSDRHRKPDLPGNSSSTMTKSAVGAILAIALAAASSIRASPPGAVVRRQWQLCSAKLHLNVCPPSTSTLYNTMLWEQTTQNGATRPLLVLTPPTVHPHSFRSLTLHSSMSPDHLPPFAKLLRILALLLPMKRPSTFQISTWSSLQAMTVVHLGTMAGITTALLA